jgi:hypothetical protein
MEVTGNDVQWRAFVLGICNFILSNMKWGISDMNTWATSVVHYMGYPDYRGSVIDWSMTGWTGPLNQANLELHILKMLLVP